MKPLDHSSATAVLTGFAALVVALTIATQSVSAAPRRNPVQVDSFPRSSQQFTGTQRCKAAAAACAAKYLQTKPGVPPNPVEYRNCIYNVGC